jgi:two-component system cell cycle response regulator
MSMYAQILDAALREHPPPPAAGATVAEALSALCIAETAWGHLRHRRTGPRPRWPTRLVVGSFDPPPNFFRRGPADPVVNYLETLADLADAYQAPVEHGSAIARWSVALANELGLDDFAQRRCALAARLHDVGKVAVPMHILTKTERLTPEDWRFIRDHPAQGELLVSAAPGMRDVAEIVGQHHERLDGTGYPKGLQGNEIRIEAQILSVCDTFASMRAARPYRPGLSEEESRAPFGRKRDATCSAFG